MKQQEPQAPERENKLAKTILKQELVSSDSHDDTAWMTRNQAWYFTQTDDPVMSRATIAHPPQPIPGRFQWALEYVKCYHGGPWEPDEYDLCELDRFDSLWEAIKAAALTERQWDIENTAQAIGMEAQFAEAL